MTAAPLVTSGPSWVYMFTDADGKALYIGIAKSWRARRRAHERTAAATWWPLVADMVTWGPIEDRREALDFERDLIEEHQPPHNVAYTPRDRRFAPAAVAS